MVHNPGVAAPTERANPVLAAVVLAVLFALPVAEALKPVFDPDIWLHLSYARWMTEHGGAIPMVDAFSRWGIENQVAYPDYIWLYQWMLWVLYQGLGLRGIVVYVLVLAVVLVGAVLTLARVHEPRPVFAGGVTLLATAGLGPSLTPRSWLFSMIGFAVVLAVVAHIRKGGDRRWLWALPPLFAFWANVHIQFAYGLLALGLAAVVPLVEARLPHLSPDRHEVPLDGATVRLLWIVLVASVLATLLNPFHVGIYGVILSYATDTAQYADIRELRPPEMDQWRAWIPVGLYGLALAAMIRTRRVRLWPLILLVIGFVLFMRARRDAWVVGITAVHLIAMATPTVEPAEAEKADPKWGWLPWALAVPLVAVFVLVSGRQQYLDNDRLEDVAALFYPAAACDFVIAEQLEGPLYNGVAWAGYLIWRLGPEGLPVSIDGRTNLHGSERMKRAVDAWAGEGWAEDPELQSANLVIANTEDPLTAILREDPGWNIAWEESGSESREVTGWRAVVFVRVPRGGPGPASPGSSVPRDR